MDQTAPITTLKAAAIVGREGTVDLTISDGKIVAINPSQSTAKTFVMPLMADAHVHLDKTFTTQRTGSCATSLFDAIDRLQADKANWTQEDIYERAAQALEKAWRHGVAAMRTHVDWMGAEPPIAWHVLTELRKTWQGKVDLQLASLSPIDILDSCGAAIAAQVKSDEGLLGAFVFKNDDLSRKIDQVFKLSDQYDLALDFHVDEGLDAAAQGFDAIVDDAARRKDGAQVLCGHACSLSTRPQDEVARVLGQAAEAGVGLVVLPTTNTYLQDNQDGRTPRLRGIAPMKEAAAAGVDVLIASDNVRDVFFPYGDYDLFDVFRGSVPLAHLEPGAWLSAITHRAAQWCDGTAINEIAINAPANFIAFDATDLDDVLSRPNAIRRVFRSGTQIQ